METEGVPLPMLAKQLGMHRTNLPKYVRNRGFKIFPIRTREAGNQETMAVSNADAEAIIELRKREGYLGRAKTNREHINGHGLFYAIQIYPTLEPGRVKLGFTHDIHQRLASYRTLCPEARVLETWHCEATWELAAIASITRTKCQRIGQELYLCDDINLVIQRGHDFFAIMPTNHGAPGKTP
jgi:hypothetical protein